MGSLYFKNWIVAKSLLEHIEGSTLLILERTNCITSSNDFINTPAGMEKLDAVCMQLIAIGEAVGKLDKITGGDLLTLEPGIPWASIKAVRNFIAHDYFDVDPEEIFHIITHDLTPMLEAVGRLKSFL